MVNVKDAKIDNMRDFALREFRIWQGRWTGQ